MTTSDAFHIYATWCTARGHVPLQPFTFARLMGMRFRKIHARFGKRTSRFFGMDKATAGTLRQAYRVSPTPPEVAARFSFAELRKIPPGDTPMSPAPKKTPPAADTVIYSITLLATKRMGQQEHTVAIVKTVGDKVAWIHPLPEANWDNIEGALRDLSQASVQLFRFRNPEGLLAGNV